MAEQTQEQKNTFGLIVLGLMIVGPATLVLGPIGLVVSGGLYLWFALKVQKGDGR